MKLKDLLEIRRFEVMKARLQKPRPDVMGERFEADMLMRESQHQEFMAHLRRSADRHHEVVTDNSAALKEVIAKLAEKGAA